jgi:hypothetical protein
LIGGMAAALLGASVSASATTDARRDGAGVRALAEGVIINDHGAREVLLSPATPSSA